MLSNHSKEKSASLPFFRPRNLKDLLKLGTDLLKDFRSRFSDTLRESQSKIDAAEFSNWIQYVASIENIEDRQAAIEESTAEAYKKGHSFFLEFTQALGETEMPIEKDNLTLPIKLEHEFYLALIKVSQEQDNFEEWLTYLEENKQDTLDDSLYLNGAGLPKTSPKITHFKERAMDFLENQPDAFSLTLNAFKETVGDYFGHNYDGFYTTGTTKAFMSLQAAVWGRHPEAHLLYSSYEYLPMAYSVPEERRSAVPIELESDEERIMEDYFERGDAILNQRETGESNDPLIILISSEFRGGGRKLDIKKIAQCVEKKNEDLGFKAYHLWVDGAQDNRFFVHQEEEVYSPDNPDLYVGDTLFFSKRVGGTGIGLALLNNKTYPRYSLENDNSDTSAPSTIPLRPEDDIAMALTERSGGGIQIEHLIHILAGLHVENLKIAHRLEDLCKTPALWRYKGLGSYLKSQTEKMQTYFDSSEILTRHFSLDLQESPEDPNEWKAHTIIRLKKNRESTLNLNTLSSSLGDLGIAVQSFSLKEMEGASMVDAELDSAAFLEGVKKFQAYHASSLLTELLPTDSHNSGELKQIVSENIEDHEILRVFMTVLHLPDTLIHLLKALEHLIISKS